MQLTYIENNQRQISICMLNWNCTFVHCTFITDITHLGSLYAFILKSLYPDFSHYFGVLELSSILNSFYRHSSHLTRSGNYHSNRLKSKRITISIRCLTSHLLSRRLLQFTACWFPRVVLFLSSLLHISARLNTCLLRFPTFRSTSLMYCCSLLSLVADKYL